MRTAIFALAAAAGTALSTLASAQVLSPQWTYQAQLKDGSVLASGSYQFYFTLYAAQTGGVALANQGTAAAPITLDVTDGNFTATLDFGGAPFAGSERWLEVNVRQGSSSSFTTLPRQRITPAPYSLFSNTTRGINVNSGGAVSIPQTFQVGPNFSGYRVGFNHPTQGEILEVSSANTAYTILSVVNTAPGGRHWAMLSTGNAYGTGGGDLVFRDVGSALDRLVLGADGNIGIGVASATAKLDVAGRVKCHVLEITGGSDIAEPYHIAPTDGVDAIPGMVVSIDSSAVGRLKVSASPYDTAVAGIVSGANGVGVGLTLTQSGSIADGELPVAAAGRVWCFVDADSGGAVKAGDLLTTSTTPGHAMKADVTRANGAILGKAMSSLESGRGMVLVMVGLQ